MLATINVRIIASGEKPQLESGIPIDLAAFIMSI